MYNLTATLFRCKGYSAQHLNGFAYMIKAKDVQKLCKIKSFSVKIELDSPSKLFFFKLLSLFDKEHGLVVYYLVL